MSTQLKEVNHCSCLIYIYHHLPSTNSADHTLNTLRYADRVKEKKVDGNLREKTPRQKSEKSKSNSFQRRQASSSRSPVRSGSPTPLTSSRLSPKVTQRSGRRLNSSRSKRLKDDSDDIDHLDASFRDNSNDDEVEEKTESSPEVQRTAQNLFDEEENLLNLHMSVIQVRFFVLFLRSL